jgi:hypothetical protein
VAQAATHITRCNVACSTQAHTRHWGRHKKHFRKQNLPQPLLHPTMTLETNLHNQSQCSPTCKQYHATPQCVAHAKHRRTANSQSTHMQSATLTCKITTHFTKAAEPETSAIHEPLSGQSCQPQMLKAGPEHNCHPHSINPQAGTRYVQLAERWLSVLLRRNTGRKVDVSRKLLGTQPKEDFQKNYVAVEQQFDKQQLTT